MAGAASLCWLGPPCRFLLNGLSTVPRTFPVLKITETLSGVMSLFARLSAMPEPNVAATCSNGTLQASSAADRPHATETTACISNVGRYRTQV